MDIKHKNTVLNDDVKMYQSSRIITGKAAETDIEGNIISYSEDMSLGIDLSDSGICAGYVETTETLVLCVSALSPNTENSLKAMKYFVDK